jgi:hypothetical protein
VRHRHQATVTVDSPGIRRKSFGLTGTSGGSHASHQSQTAQRQGHQGQGQRSPPPRTSQRRASQAVAMTPTRMANILNTEPKLLKEFCGHFAKPGDGDDTVMLYADGRAFVIPVFDSKWAPGG